MWPCCPRDGPRLWETTVHSNKTSKQVLPKMDPEKIQPEKQLSPVAAAKPAITSCRKKKSEDASFLADLRDHIDEFIHSSMDEHKTCFKNTVQKMFGMSEVVAERSSDTKEVESSVPLQTNVAK